MRISADVSIDQVVLFNLRFVELEAPGVEDVVSEIRVAEALVAIALAVDRDWGIFAGSRNVRDRASRLGQYLTQVNPVTVNRLSLQSPLTIELLLNAATINAIGSSAVALGFGLNRLMRSTMRTYSEWLDARVGHVEAKQRRLLAESQLKSMQAGFRRMEADPDSFSRLAISLLDMRPAGLRDAPIADARLAQELQSLEAVGQERKSTDDQVAAAELIRLARSAPKLIDEWRVD